MSVVLVLEISVPFSFALQALLVIKLLCGFTVVPSYLDRTKNKFHVVILDGSGRWDFVCV
jgi:hypothetical protein